MPRCVECWGEVEAAHRFCPWCGGAQRRKLVQFFAASDVVSEDEGRALRVSRYLHEGHVRFSVWNESGSADAAVSLDDAEALRLAAFVGAAATARRHSLLDDLRVLGARVRGR